MDTCYQNLVGIKTDCETTPARLYLQQLNGMTVRFGANIADEDYQTAKAVFHNAIEMATMEVLSDFQVNIAKYLRIGNIVENACLCTLPTNAQYTPLQPGRVGINIVNNAPSSGKQKIDKINILANQTGIYVLSINDDGIITNQNVSLTANSSTPIDLNYTAQNKNVSISFDAAQVQLAKIACGSTTSGCGCNGSNAKKADSGQLRKMTVSGILGNSGSTDLYGIQPCLQWQCDTDKMLCQFADYLAAPILYRAGILVMQRALASERTNYVTLYDAESKKERIAEWQNRYNIEMTNVIAIAPQAIKNFNDNDCWVCEENGRSIKTAFGF